MAQKVVIALGGNAILQPKQQATYENQIANIQKSCEVIARIVRQGYEVIITHGNGPQVGNILRQQDEAREVVPPFPLHVCSAESQGFIGYMMDQCMKNELQKLGLNQAVTSILTQTEVSLKDPAFLNPTKPIGVFYSEEEAKRLAEDKGWVVKEDAGRGWRRVVPSPMPQSIVGADVIKSLASQGAIVIAAGGGGIPVSRQTDGTLVGVEAVIDKDRSGYQLAQDVQADIFMILTDVHNVYVNYGKPNQKSLETISLEEAKRYADEGQFSVGSMGPKMESAIGFAEKGGIAIICSLDQADLALEGGAGTRIVQDNLLRCM
ncbi:carbamate kinase [Paenibacillus lautus]|uniref:carbamate kinase n=1 Tax=Paenibacillus lautus TaxID=1401 RepID=UPI003D26D946